MSTRGHEGELPVHAAEGPLAIGLVLEHVAELARLQNRLLAEARWPKREMIYRGTATLGADVGGGYTTKTVKLASGFASGTSMVGLDIYTVPAGMTFQLTRLLVETSAYDAASPYTNTEFWLGVFVNAPGLGYTQDFEPIPDATQALPALATYPDKAGPYFRSGEKVWVGMVNYAGTNTANFYFNFTGVLREATE